MYTTSQQIKWVNTFKGIGITLVVIGHVWQPGHRYIFWFHMPLFFFISGYLYKPEKPVKDFFLHKCRTLLIPYCMFLFLLSIPDYMHIMRFSANGSNEFIQAAVSLTMKLIYGGRDLYGWFDVFWFVTALFLTQQIFHTILRLTNRQRTALYGIIACMFIYASISSFYPQLRLPTFWGINIVPLAIVFYFLGYLTHHKNFNLKHISLLSLIVFMCMTGLALGGIVHHEFNMKWEVYGIPVLNVVIAMSGIFSVYALCLLISFSPPVESVFIAVGKASLVIMFCHQALRQLIFSRLPFAVNDWIVIITVLAACYALFFLLRISPFTAQLFLGRVKKNYPTGI